MRFRGKTAVVTGGSSGMGFAAAQAFLAEGANVAICGRTKDKLDQATERLKGGTSGDVMAIAADVSRIADLDRLYQQVSDRFGKIHVVFANAGVGIPTGPDPVD
ncbi:MAG: SDR family NAD(P)-dependent oxidoreductase, partial [Cyanobacteria bacterium P01_A01_bin.135]